MRIFRYFPRLRPRLSANAIERARRVFCLTGTTTCLLAIFISTGGHLAVLQSIAYTRMLVEFAQQDSWCTAVKKTFDDRYACSLCPKIRNSFNSEQKTPQTLSEVHQPEFLPGSDTLIYFTPVVVAEVAFVCSRRVDFSNAPPRPPPRVA
jgi:hypothetical protein